MKNIEERRKMVRAMDTVIRNLDNEDFLESWLAVGVEDHDGDLTDDEIDFYCEDSNFADLMWLFCRLMNRATNYDRDYNFDGTLYCDGIVSKEEEL